MANQGVAGVANPYAPTIPELVNLGYLPQGFGSKAPNGQVFTSNVTQVCPGGNCTLAGYVYSSTPYKDGTGAVRNDLAGIAMQAAGADAGMTPPGQAGQLVGTGNGWQTPMAGVQVGTFAMRVGSYSATDAILSQFYMLNGSRALTGAMNANGNNINSVGNLSAQGKIATNGLNANDMPSGWGGGVRTWDVYAGGTVGVGAGGGAIPLAYMNNTGLVQGQTVNSNGNVNASGTLWSNGGVVTNGNMTLATSNAQITNPGRMHINVGENLYLQPWSGGTTIVGGGGGSGNLQVTGTTWMYGPTVNQGYTYLNGGGVVNSSLSMAATAWAGWGCSGNGITTDPNGQLLSCQSGVWQATGGGGSAVAYCKSTSCGVTLPSAGTWDISGTAYAQQAAWSGATFWINGSVVDTNANWGDQAGTGYGVMSGSYRIAVGGPTYISASTSWGAAWGDYTINLHATKE